MSRHRDIRCMKYSDEYDGYDDIYGHSVEDDYCVSPGAEQFMYDRNKQQNIASFITEPDIKEDNEEEYKERAESSKNSELSDIDTTKLISCIQVIKNVIGDALPDTILKEKIIAYDFDTATTLDHILNTTLATKKPIDTTFEAKKPIIAQAGERLPSSSENLKSKQNQSSSYLELVSNHKPKLSNVSLKSSMSLKQKTPIQQSSQMNSSSTNTKTVIPNKLSFNSLAEMTAHHLEKSKDSLNKSNFSPKLFTKLVIPKLNSRLLKDQINVLNDDNNVIDQLKQHNDENTSSVIDNSEIKKLSNHEIQKPPNESDNLGKLSMEIDLTAALQNSNKLRKKEKTYEHVQESSEQMFDFTKISEKLDYLPSSILVQSSNVLECSLSMKSLHYKKLNHSNKVVSLFGKILCKKWKTHSKPYIKLYRSEFKKNIQRFDFTSLSPDGIILSSLRRL